MKAFDKYSAYYDLLYADKDYSAECCYIEKLISRYCDQPDTILDLGCGTGRHLAILASNQQRSAQGVDVSQTMVILARRNHPQHNFCCCDIADFRDDKRYDIITSLFHVASYQTDNEQLRKYFATVAAQLTIGGVFIFDCWYGPGVLSDKPSSRTKTMENNSISVKRIATPTLYPNDNCVNVHYDVEIVDKYNGEKLQLAENHLMRYLFMPELKLFAESAGLEIVASYKWLTEDAPDIDTWYACFVLKHTSPNPQIPNPPIPNPQSPIPNPQSPIPNP